VAVLSAYLTTHFKLGDLAWNAIEYGALGLAVVALAIGFHRHHTWIEFGLGLIPAALLAATYTTTRFIVSALYGNPQTNQWAAFWLEVEWELLTIASLVGYVILWLAIKTFK